MSKWDFGRLTSFLESVMADAGRIRDWLQTQRHDDLDVAELARLYDSAAHEWEGLKRLVKRVRLTKR